MSTISKRGLDDNEFIDIIKRVDTSLVRTPADRRQELDKRLSDLMDFQDTMDDWEYDFLNSMVELLGKEAKLTEGQMEKIEEMERKYL